MSLDDWKSELAAAWIAKTGNTGDFYRCTLINPILAFLLNAPEHQLDEGVFHHAIAASLSDKQGPIDVVFSGARRDQWRPSFLPNNVSKWMQANPVEPPSYMGIADLGCGEGYRGRWLTRRGFGYLGVDGSTELIRHAKSSSPDLSDLYHELDLESAKAQSQLSDLISGQVNLPKWLLAITLFDHLNEDALSNLLNTVSSCFGIGSSAYMLVVTCNPQFYRALPDTNQPQSAEFESMRLAEDSPARVKIFHRSRTWYSMLFRDSGVTVLDQLTPLPLVNSSGTSDHDRGVGPFSFWLLKVGDRTRQRVSLGRSRSWLAKYSALEPTGAARALLSTMDNKAQCFELQKPEGQPIVAAHNMGGNLFVVLSGLAALDKQTDSGGDAGSGKTRQSSKKQNRSVPQILFGPGSVFGDLELSVGKESGERPTYYRQSVFSHAAETMVLEIPSSSAEQVIAKSRGHIATELFAQLRVRLQSQIWLLGSRRINSVKPIDCDKYKVWDKSEITRMHLQAVHFLACTLLAAWELQRVQLTRPTPAVNTLILKSLTESAMLAGDLEGEMPGEALRMLNDAGVVLGWPANAYRDFDTLLDSVFRGMKIMVEEPTHAPDSLKPLSNVIRDRKSPHFIVLDDLWLLRRLAMKPDQGAFQLLAAATHCQRLREALGRTNLPTYEQIAHRFGDDVNRRYANLIGRLVKARADEGIAAFDSLGVPL